MITVIYKTLGEQTATVRCEKIVSAKDKGFPEYLLLKLGDLGLSVHPEQIVSITKEA